ncbi:hypothetical protein HHI36_009493 [Cryptolaemus montrouzieri]|uniref:Uncharacterized protein n=1 Tax=Cryptolaemus montrouzieri TaxID=559131 RepID=A0ABD2MFT9_9CUCU
MKISLDKINIVAISEDEICLVLAIGCHADEELIATVVPENIENALKSENNTHPPENAIIYNITTSPINLENHTLDEQLNSKRKVAKVKKLKKNWKNDSISPIFQKIKDYNTESNTETKYGYDPPQNFHFSPMYNSLRLENNNRTQYQVFEGTTEKPSIVRGSTRINWPLQKDYNSDSRPNRLRNNQHYLMENKQVFHENQGQESRNIIDVRNKDNAVKFVYKFEVQPQESNTIHRHEQPSKPYKKQRRGGRPSLPEIQNVIQTLDNQESSNSYHSPKQNHIVEVNEVPLVFEHHYQGDFKSPEKNFITHQYSYNPPADNTDEAYQLGKILSQNVVQKLHTSQKPLREYIDDQQELVLRRPTYESITNSQQHYVTPSKDNLRNSHYTNPIMKYLVPEITQQEFAQDIHHFQSNVNHYQSTVPKTKIQPIVVQDEQPNAEYDTTYLQSVNEQGLQNNYNHNPSSNQQELTNSPYFVNVVKHLMQAPPYTMMHYLNLQDTQQPQALHEVEAPNLSNSNNINVAKTPTRPILPTPIPDYIGTHEHNTIFSTPHSDYNEGNSIDDLHSSLRLGDIIARPEIVYMLTHSSPIPSSVPHHRPKTQMSPSRPYWKKPKSLKLKKVTPNHNFYHHEQKFRPLHENNEKFKNFGTDNYSRNIPRLRPNPEEDFTSSHITDFKSNPSIRYQDLSEYYPSNVVSVITHQQNIPPQTSETYQSEEVYPPSQREPSSEPKEVYYTPEAYGTQTLKEGSSSFQNNEENRLHQENKQNNNQVEIEIVKSVSPELTEVPDNYESLNQNAIYVKPLSEEDTQQGGHLPRGYLTFQKPINNVRLPHLIKDERPRHLVRTRLSPESYDFEHKIVQPRLRRLVSNLLADRHKNVDYFLIVRENDAI